MTAYFEVISEDFKPLIRVPTIIRKNESVVGL